MTNLPMVEKAEIVESRMPATVPLTARGFARLMRVRKSTRHRNTHTLLQARPSKIVNSFLAGATLADHRLTSTVREGDATI